ncbi:MAG: ABC transporter substrate-binding protein [Candidatus Hydrogenedentes bacterium]|nr:ABC transporter substrate-binding protein [Candidatus Hydrogenedentota bacterium]
MKLKSACGLILCFLAALTGCAGPIEETVTGGTPAALRTFQPINPDAAVFWDRQTTETRQLLLQLADEFNRLHPDLPIKVEHSGGYTEINRKVAASIQAGALPSMAVAYESMTAEYVQAGAVAALDEFTRDPQRGLSAADLADFFPAVLETNRYSEFEGKMYSFPFCKSALMMYFNKRVLADAGFSQPPNTWDEFLEQCRQVKEKTGKFACALNVDCSTVDGMIYSMGGELVKDHATLFDSLEAMRVFELIETLVREKLAYQITRDSYDDESALAQDQIAFLFRSSSGRTSIARLMQGDMQRWGMTRIPQADPADPRTVLYGPNIVIFNTTPDQQRAAWEFVKFFTSPEIGVRWALGTGYIPIRRSAAQHPDVQAFWNEWEYNRAAFDCLAFARSEPNFAGWQEVRELVHDAETAILTGMKNARAAATELKQAADQVLSARHARSTR